MELAVPFCDGCELDFVIITRLVRNCALERVIQYSRDSSD